MLFVNLVGRHMTVETTYKTFAVHYSQSFTVKKILEIFENNFKIDKRNLFNEWEKIDKRWTIFNCS